MGPPYGENYTGVVLRGGRYVSVNVNDVQPSDLRSDQGWRKMDMRFVLGEHVGVEAVCVFRAVFQPGAAHEKHVHPLADEFSFIVRGRAALGFEDEEHICEAGTARFIPAGTVHWLRSVDPDHEVEVVGAYLGVSSLQAAGYEFVAHVE